MAEPVDTLRCGDQFDEVPVISSISINEAGERNITSTNAARVHMHSPDVDKEVLERASIVLVDGHYMQACQSWVKAARSLGKLAACSAAEGGEGGPQSRGYCSAPLCLPSGNDRRWHNWQSWAA